MASTIEVLNHRITFAIGMITIIGAGLAFMDSRHASAMDVNQLTEMILDDRVDNLEFQVQQAEDRLSRLELVTDEELTPWEEYEINDLENLIERYIRKLERIQR